MNEEERGRSFHALKQSYAQYIPRTKHIKTTLRHVKLKFLETTIKRKS